MRSSFQKLLSLAFSRNRRLETKDTRVNEWTDFDRSQHFRPELSRKLYDSLAGSNFVWAFTDPLYSKQLWEEGENNGMARLSPGQKSILFFGYLQGQMQNYGFLQFYVNQYAKYVPALLDGLKLIGDTKLWQLVHDADQIYLFNSSSFQNVPHGMWGGEPPGDLKKLYSLDDAYFAIEDQTILLFEKYIRAHPEEFVNFK